MRITSGDVLSPVQTEHMWTARIVVDGREDAVLCSAVTETAAIELRRRVLDRDRIAAAGSAIRPELKGDPWAAMIDVPDGHGSVMCSDDTCESVEKLRALVIAAPAKQKNIPTCPYCRQPAVLIKFGKPDYPESFNAGPIWVCVRDDAWIGCRKGAEPQPSGRLANIDDRALKIQARFLLNGLAKQGKLFKDRAAGVEWLRAKLGTSQHDTMSFDKVNRQMLNRIISTLAEAARNA